MKRLLLTLAFLLLATTLAADNAKASVLITSVDVDVNGTHWCNTGNVTGGCATGNHLWNLGAGILLNANDTLVLTQTAGFNFDASDVCGAPGNCRAPRVLVNGLSFTDAGKILAGQGAGVVDPVNNQNNEAHDWTLLGILSEIAVSAGYADTEHTNPCADANGTCLPENPWEGTATYFLGSGIAPDVAGTNCRGACFDSAALLIQDSVRRVPQPGTLFLLGLGVSMAGLFRFYRARP